MITNYLGQIRIKIKSWCCVWKVIVMQSIVSGFSETNFNRWFRTPLNPRVGLGGVLLRGLTRGCRPLGMGGDILIDQEGEVLT